jgi:hypothetical protein
LSSLLGDLDLDGVTRLFLSDRRQIAKAPRDLKSGSQDGPLVK